LVVLLLFVLFSLIVSKKYDTKLYPEYHLIKKERALFEERYKISLKEVLQEENRAKKAMKIMLLIVVILGPIITVLAFFEKPLEIIEKIFFNYRNYFYSLYPHYRQHLYAFCFL